MGRPTRQKRLAQLVFLGLDEMLTEADGYDIRYAALDGLIEIAHYIVMHEEKINLIASPDDLDADGVMTEPQARAFFEAHDDEELDLVAQSLEVTWVRDEVDRPALVDSLIGRFKKMDMISLDTKTHVGPVDEDLPEAEVVGDVSVAAQEADASQNAATAARARAQAAQQRASMSTEAADHENAPQRHDTHVNPANRMLPPNGGHSEEEQFGQERRGSYVVLVMAFALVVAVVGLVLYLPFAENEAPVEAQTTVTGVESQSTEGVEATSDDIESDELAEIALKAMPSEPAPTEVAVADPVPLADSPEEMVEPSRDELLRKLFAERPVDVGVADEPVAPEPLPVPVQLPSDLNADATVDGEGKQEDSDEAAIAKLPKKKGAEEVIAEAKPEVEEKADEAEPAEEKVVVAAKEKREPRGPTKAQINAEQKRSKREIRKQKIAEDKAFVKLARQYCMMEGSQHACLVILPEAEAAYRKTRGKRGKKVAAKEKVHSEDVAPKEPAEDGFMKSAAEREAGVPQKPLLSARAVDRCWKSTASDEFFEPSLKGNKRERAARAFCINRLLAQK